MEKLSFSKVNPPEVRVKTTLPIEAVNTSNRREHWTERSARNQVQRSGTRLALNAKRVCAQVTLNDGLLVTVTRVAPRELDSHDNLRTALKPVVDGVADALRLKNDKDPRVTWRYAQRRGKVRQYAVEIEITERPAACPTCGLLGGAP
jgi:hypothetical protein